MLNLLLNLPRSMLRSQLLWSLVFLWHQLSLPFLLEFSVLIPLPKMLLEISYAHKPFVLLNTLAICTRVLFVNHTNCLLMLKFTECCRIYIDVHKQSKFPFPIGLLLDILKHWCFRAAFLNRRDQSRWWDWKS